MENINSRLNIGGKTLRNRVVVPPMASQTADTLGFVTEKTLDHYKRLTTSRASLVMVEYTYVHPSGRSEENQLGISSDLHLAGLERLARTLKKAGVLSAIQLTHAGGKSSRELSGGRLISPSGIKVPIKGGGLEIPDEASLNEIELLKKSFVTAAIRAHKAGFDMIELHSAHGYGLNQWLSPITNQREDKYGGSHKKRMTLLLEILTEIRSAIPGVLLSVRMPGMDHFPGGMTAKQSQFLAQALERAGVNLLNISSGMGGWRRPRDREGEGYLVADAKRISSVTNIPVMGVGGIKTAAYINSELKKKSFSLAAVGRRILEDPTWGPSIGLR